MTTTAATARIEWVSRGQDTREIYRIGWTENGRDFELVLCSEVVDLVVECLLDSGVGAVTVQYMGSVRR